MLQLTNERWADNKGERTLKAELSDELADILAETLFIAHELDINLQEAWQNMLDSDQRKVTSRSKNV
jgi:NTP pyrophosphatase (non-canonical NTP hydrolase)